jgi:Tfp pilus assembly protein PilN
MRAVNLIPNDSRRGWRSASARGGGSVYLFLGTLAIALVLVTAYVLASNQVSNQKAKITALQTEATEAQSAASRLSPYVEFAKLAQARTETVREIASSRFNWYGALAGLSRVVPANTSLQSLVGTVVPGVTVGGAGGGGAAADLRTDIAAPAFELSGCSDSQDDVARLISRLRLIDGVTRVSLESSQKSASSQSGASVTSGTSGGGGCRGNAPSFDLVVFFQPLANAGANGPTSLSAGPASSTKSTGGSQ